MDWLTGLSKSAKWMAIVLLLEAVIAQFDSGRIAMLDHFSDWFHGVIPAVDNFDAKVSSEHVVRNFVALTLLLFPLKIWLIFNWLTEHADSARRLVLISPMSGKSVGYSLFIGVIVAGLAFVSIWQVMTIGDDYWRDPTKASPFAKVVFEWMLRGDIWMWLGQSFFNTTGYAIAPAILLATAKEWWLFGTTSCWRIKK